MEDSKYTKDWALKFNPQKTYRVSVPDSAKKGGRKIVYLTEEQYEVAKAVKNPANRLAALEQELRLKADRDSGKTYSQIPVSRPDARGKGGPDRYKVHDEFLGIAYDVFRAAGYVVTELHRSPFNFVACKGKGAETETYYVLVKCGKALKRTSLSQRQLLRMKEQYLNPRFGTQNVTKLYWYACSTDKSHRTYSVGVQGGYGMTPIPHPIPEFASWMPQTNEQRQYLCKPISAPE